MADSSKSYRGPGIYRISLPDGRCYIGQSIHCHRRWIEHRGRLRRSKHWLPYLQNAWNKYGEEAFTFEVLERCPPEQMTEREQWWLDELHPTFNVCPTAGSSAGYKRPFRNLTPEHRAKISAAHKGKVHSAEHRASISATLMGRPGHGRGKPLSAETKAKLSRVQKARLARLREEGRLLPRPRKTHCKHGHEFTTENTYINPRTGYRMCRRCVRVRYPSTRDRYRTPNE